MPAAELPNQIRGFGHVKEANVARIRAAEAGMLDRFEETGTVGADTVQASRMLHATA